MSTMDSAEVIAEALAKHQLKSLLFDEGRCACGYWLDVADNPSVDRIRRMHRAHQASAVAALPDIAIVPRKDIVRIYRAASTLGQQYMMPTHFGADREEAERWFGLQQKMLDGLPGVDTVRLEYQDMWFTDWAPLNATGGES